MDIVERLIDTNFKGQEHMRFEAATEITRLREENKVMREALAYYADDGHYDSGDVPCHIYVLDDHGRTARTALATTGGE